MSRRRSFEQCLIRVRPPFNGYWALVAALFLAASYSPAATGANLTLTSATATQSSQSVTGNKLLTLRTDRGSATVDYGLFSGSINLPATTRHPGDAGDPYPQFSDHGHHNGAVNDVVTITDPSRTGTIGYFHPIIAVPKIAWLVDVSYSENFPGANGQAGAGLDLSVNGAQGGQSIQLGSEGHIQNSFSYTATPGAVPFVFGEPFQFQIHTGVSAGVGVSVESQHEDAFSAGAASIMASTVWGGFQSITDENGNVVTGAVLTSESGIDWSKSDLVPWRGSTGTDFATGSNWYFGNKPNSNQTAYLGNANTATIMNVSGDNNRLVAASGDTSLFVSTYNLSSNLADVPGLLVGHLNQEEATLRLVSGQTTTTNSVISDVAGSIGNLYVSGDSSSLDVSELLLVGDAGTGTLRVSEGADMDIGTLTVAANIGSDLSSVTVTDIATRMTAKTVEVGGEADGSLSVEDGAEVFAESVALGKYETGNGVLVIAGEDSKLTMEGQPGGTSKMVIGLAGEGHVVVKEQGELNAEVAEVIVGFGKRGVIDVDNGQFKAASVQIGGEGLASGNINAQGVNGNVDISGRLDLYEGGFHLNHQASAQVSELRAGLRDESVITLDGNADLTIGPTTEPIALQLGGAAEGKIEIGILHNEAESATLLVDGKTTIGSTSGVSSLSVGGTGSTATFRGTVAVGAVGASLDVGSGRLDVGENAHVFAPAGIGVYALGTLTGKGRITGDVHDYGGQIDPGSSPGTLTIDGNLTIDAGSLLNMEIAGSQPGQFDVLAVTGVTQLGGTLQLIFRDGFAPHTGDVFDLFDGPSALGAFDAVEVRGLEPGWQYALDPSSLRVTSLNDGVAVPEPPTLALLIFAAARWCLRRVRTHRKHQQLINA